MTDSLTIVQYGGSWITNIGNAFFDLGSITAIENGTSNKVQTSISSSFGRWVGEKFKRTPLDFLRRRRSGTGNFFDPGSAIDADYIIQSGACLSQRWFDLRGDVLRTAQEQGAKLIFHGIGFSEWAYTPEEVKEVQNWMEETDPHAIISRDERTFNILKGTAEHSYNGIDCGFYINDMYEPMEFHDGSFIAVNFDKKEEPNSSHFYKRDQTIVRPHHSFWYPWSLFQYPDMISQYYHQNNVFVSDVPEEYLNIYANADATYADRVHACVATLSFGNPARLYIDTPRSYLLDRVGLEDITNELTEPNLNRLQREKTEQMEFLDEIIR